MAASPYVLPYPSFMPGSVLYAGSRMIDRGSRYWHFGTIASIKYHQKLADKYLVEAKILFEYLQYPLALDALARSTAQVHEIPLLLAALEREKKDDSVFVRTFGSEIERHNEVLVQLVGTLPEKFLWVAEKSAPKELLLRQIVGTAIEERNNVLSQL